MTFPKEKLRRILFLDIETASQVSSYEEMSVEFQRLWDTRARRYFEQRSVEMDDEKVAQYYQDKSAIYAEYAKVICISVGYLDKDGPEGQFRVMSIAGDDEVDVLTRFSALLYDHYYDSYYHFLCGHNIKEFDIPFLARRYVINKIKLPNLLNIAGTKPWQVHHLLDTMDMWKFGDYKHYSSLNMLCHVLGVPSPKMEMSGKDVNQAYWEGRLPEIVAYCEYDLIATARVYLRLIETDPFSDESVVYVTPLDKEE